MFSRMRARFRLRRLCDAWRQYHDIVIQALDSPRSAVRNESRFLELQASLAAQLQALSDTLPASVITESRRNIAAMIDLLKGQRSLNPAECKPPWGKQEFGAIWHEHYIQLSKLRGVALDSGPATSVRKPAPVPTGFGKPGQAKRQLNLRPLRVGLGILCLALVLGAASYALGIRIDAKGHFEVGNQSALGRAVQDGLNTFEALGQDFLQFFGPVIDLYGPDLTTVLFAILLLLLGCWIFIRV